MHLGTLLPTIADIERMVARVNERVWAETSVPEAERLAVMLLPFEDYCYALEKRNQIGREELRRAALARQEAMTGKPSVSLQTLGEENPLVLAFLQRPRDASLTPDVKGYLRYLVSARVPLEKALKHYTSPAQFPEITRRMHTLIVAGTGHGKSEAIKALLHHYAIHPGAGVLVLDPGRNLALDVARWPILHRDRRVIYVEPELRPGLTVGINPFSGGHLLEERVKNHLAETIALAVSEMTTELTLNMKTLVANLCMVLLDEPDATMADLGRMAHKPQEGGRFRDERRDRLMERAYYHPDPDLRDFFQYRFDAQTYTSSRDALAGRIDHVTSMLDVRNALFGPATLDLERELNAGKFVLVNLNKYGEREQRAAVGRMLVAMVAGIANRRGQVSPPYTPLHLVVDEVTAMASAPMIWTLAEQRKFGLHATLAQQVAGAAFTAEEKAALVTNTKCRIIASGNHKYGADLLEFAGSPDELPPVSEGQFWVRWGDDTEIKTVQFRSDLVVRNKQGDVVPNPPPDAWLPEPQWHAYLDRLTATPNAGGYYRQARTRPLHAQGAPQQPLRPAPADKPTPVETAERTFVRSAEAETPAKPQRGRAAQAPILVVNAGATPVRKETDERTTVRTAEPRSAGAKPTLERTDKRTDVRTAAPRSAPVEPVPPAESEERDMLKKPELPNRTAPQVRKPSGPIPDTAGLPPLRSADVGLQKPVRPIDRLNGEVPAAPATAKPAPAPGRLIRPEKPAKAPVAARKFPSINKDSEPD